MQALGLGLEQPYDFSLGSSTVVVHESLSFCNCSCVVLQSPSHKQD